jgi:hypothetical protein
MFPTHPVGVLGLEGFRREVLKHIAVLLWREAIALH